MDIKICSHTLVRNGMPFMPLVLEQVLPYMNRCLVTISEKSTDETKEALLKLQKTEPKIHILYENVTLPEFLTQERQKQVDITHEDWILFLDDDDYWPKESIEEILPMLNEDIDAISVSPYQVNSKLFYDIHWKLHKQFTKWFRNKDIKYRGPWPRDNIFMNKIPLHYKWNKRTKRLYGKYFHLANIKSNSFRKEEWTLGHYEQKALNDTAYPDWADKHLEKIFEYVK